MIPQKATPATRSAPYANSEASVKKVRDFIAGGDGVKPYIHKLPGHEPEDDKLFRKYAYFLPAVARSHEAFTGLIMEPEPQVSDAADGLQAYLDDLTNDGEPFQRVAFRTVQEVAAVARYCLVVDVPAVDGAETLSKLEAAEVGVRPYVRGYTRESIIDVRTASIGGVRKLNHLRLMETIEIDGATEWQTKQISQIRVMDLVGGKYRVRIFRMAEKPGGMKPGDPAAEWIQEGEDVFPLMGGKPLDYIPAVLFGPSTLDADVLEPPTMLEMCEVSQSHLNDSALRQWGLMWCGNPQPYIAGLAADVDDEAADEGGEAGGATTIRWGSSTALILTESGSAGMVTMDGAGLGALKDSMEEKRRDLAAIGARILTDDTRAPIAANTVKMQRAGEHSVLAGMANTVADGLTQILRMVAEWAGIEQRGQNTERVAVTLNTDFLPRGLEPGELAEWFAALQSGQLPLTVLIEHLKSRGVVDPQMDEQAWRDGSEGDVLTPPPPAPPAPPAGE